MIAGISQKKMIDHIGLAEGEGEYVCNMDGGTNETDDIRDNNEPCTCPCSHDGGIM